MCFSCTNTQTHTRARARTRTHTQGSSDNATTPARSNLLALRSEDGAEFDLANPLSSTSPRTTDLAAAVRVATIQRAKASQLEEDLGAARAVSVVFLVEAVVSVCMYYALQPFSVQRRASWRRSWELHVR